jgi:hypothetical protein
MLVPFEYGFVLLLVVGRHSYSTRHGLRVIYPQPLKNRPIELILWDISWNETDGSRPKSLIWYTSGKPDIALTRQSNKANIRKILKLEIDLFATMKRQPHYGKLNDGRYPHCGKFNEDFDHILRCPHNHQESATNQDKIMDKIDGAFTNYIHVHMWLTPLK